MEDLVTDESANGKDACLSGSYKRLESYLDSLPIEVADQISAGLLLILKTQPK
ncbi:hypothetical protein FD02_GL001869 [Lacticaseibacillus nasuensis JCM 17158]|uniref:Uncharacterized protein n=1 Tax=Lacticaseibacillus nasuensis JCM 17158 TaxID=1291734 RepID=A0A0R1JRX0_9LACO|nr:hypothetical protein FD02_GL001869 [Lacticaseibacillus nasuensis JCM 17158]